MAIAGALRSQLLNASLTDHIRFVRPIVQTEFAAIRTKVRSPVILEILPTKLQLRGQLLLLDQPAIVFPGSPCAENTAVLASFGLKLKDFAIHDAASDFILLQSLSGKAIHNVLSLR